MSSVATLPQFTLELNGSSLPQGSVEALTEVRVQQALSQPALCELTFQIGRDPLPGILSISTGARLRLTVAPGASLLFDGEVTAIEYTYEPAYQRVIRIRGYDVLHRLRKRQPVRVHVQITPADLSRDLVADLSLTVTASETGPMIPRIIQYKQSDFEMLAEVTRRLGLYFTLRDDVLHLITLEGIDDPIPLKLGTSLLEARVEVNAESACRSVTARGWDAARVEEHEGVAEQARSGRDVTVQAAPGNFGEDGKRAVVGEVLPDDIHAEAVAQAELDLRTAKEVTFWGIAEGNAELMPGTRVNVTGVASALEGQYSLTTVTHLFNRKAGFTSEISTAPSTFKSNARPPSATWGLVTQVDDPEYLGRVQVSLPALGDVETGWLGVLAAGAGGGKGIVAMPDVGDQVLVLFLDGDTSSGLVLGGLYGLHGPEDYGVEGSSIRRYTFCTSGGQKIRLDDTGQSIRIENKGGSFVELSPEKVQLHSEVNLEIDAPGREVTITGKTIDFRQG
ncbi:phage baseplate assembly protein V [Acidobacterium sp. S8]|uniref:phage baseplate assembly protein V n=1 Tax=Acidobacterium sp. S8 TaxID=1641854 RepID=UPI00131AC32A|nr:phage baseplate assembly protein V [Acidobacterium sp. S8]